MKPTMTAIRCRCAALAASLAAGLLLAGPASAQEPATIPQRVVSVGGSLTEILYALGLEAHVIAVDSTSVYPPEAAARPQVGYMRTLSPEGILATAPDLILALEGSGPPEALDVLRRAEVPVTIIPDDPSIAGIAAKVRAVAAIFGRQAEGEALATRIVADIEDVEAVVAGLPARKRVIFVLSFAGDRLLAAGTGTAADAIIRLAGAENAMSGYSGYKQATDEAIAAAAPDVVLAMHGGGPDPVTAEQAFALPALAATPAAADRAFIALDGQFLLGFGPRTADAIKALAAELYPGAVPADWAAAPELR